MSNHQWIGNKSFYIHDTTNSTLSNMTEGYEPFSNYNTKITSKSYDYSKPPQPPPPPPQQQQQQNDAFHGNIPRIVLSPQLQRPIRNDQPIHETYFQSKQSYSSLFVQNRLETDHKSIIRQQNPYINHIQSYTKSSIQIMPESIISMNRLCKNQYQSNLNPCLLSYESTKPIESYLRPSTNVLIPKRTLSLEIPNHYLINTNKIMNPPPPPRRTISPIKCCILENHNNNNNNEEEPDIWNIGSSSGFDQSITFRHRRSRVSRSSFYDQKYKLLNKSKHHGDMNVINSECGSLLSTDEETVSLNTIDSEENMNVLNRYSNSLQPLNRNKQEIYGSTKTLIPSSKSWKFHHQDYPLSSSCKSVHWNKSQSNLMNKRLIPSDRKIETNLPLSIQPNNLPNSVNSPQFPYSSSVYDQPTTITKTYGDPSGDQWTVYYRNPNIPNIHIESSINDKPTTILGLSIPNKSTLHPNSYKSPLQHSNEYTTQIKNNQLVIPSKSSILETSSNFPNRIKLNQTNEMGSLDNTPHLPKKKRREQRLFSKKQTEYLIHSLESLINSIEKNNFNLELELKETNHLLNLNDKQSLCQQNPNHDLNLHRNSSLTTKIHPKGLNTKHGIVNRNEYKRKSANLNHLDEFTQNRNEKVAVEVRVVFLKIGEIDTLKELYYADAFLQAKWREPKLDGHTAEELSITELEQYWNPLLYIDNILSETKDTQWIMAVRNEYGEVYLMERRRIKGVFLETLELNDFPLDVQDLTITVTTERPDTEVDIIPDQVEMSAINIQTFVDQQEWKLHEHVEIKKRIIKQEYSSSMKSHPCLSVTCRAARRPGYFYWNVFLIMFMISGLAFATFAVSPDKAELRLRLSFTLILTSVTFKYVITQSLPKISYLTYMDKYVLMSLFILCIISIWHAVVTLIGLDFDLPDSPGFGSSLPGSTTTTTATSASISSNLNVNTTNQGPRSYFPNYNKSESIQSTLNQSHHNSKMIGSNYKFQNTSQILEQMNTSDVLPSLHNLSSLPPSSILSTPSMYNNLLQNDSFTSLSKTPLVMTTTVNQTFNSLLKEQNNGCSRTNRMACSDWKMVQQIEKHVFISFVTIYILAHAIFIFWLYFDASRRRREMTQKDKDYRATKRPINQREFGSGTSL
uniref:Putative nicotinic acetylcholine receptor alpha 9b subunit n=1 Tax=Schistosoma mansoni TaxID=6183 RepID=A0A5K4EMP5_SCHMA